MSICFLKNFEGMSLRIEGDCRVDIGIVWDDTRSIDATEWEQIANFTKVLAKEIRLSENGAHIGITTYGWQPNNVGAFLVIKLGDHTDYTKFAAAVDDLINTRKNMGGNMIHLGLEMSLNEMFNIANGARPNTNKALILITDGDCFKCDTDEVKENLTNVAGRIKDAKIKMLMIGVGIKYEQVDQFDVTQFVGKHDFSEVQDLGELVGSALLNQMAVVCDGMYFRYLQMYNLQPISN